MRPERKREVVQVRCEGAAAAEAGRHPDTNPYPTYTMNRYQWFRGYREWQWQTQVEDQRRQDQ